MKNLITVGACVVLLFFGLWPVALILVYAVSCQQLMNEKRRLDEEPMVLPNFEQKQLRAIVDALEAGQVRKAGLLKRRFQLEW